MQVLNLVDYMTCPPKDDFYPITTSELLDDIAAYVRLLGQWWYDREARDGLLWQLETAVQALACAAGGAVVLRAEDGSSGEVYYAVAE
jgi:hypothetical protein